MRLALSSQAIEPVPAIASMDSRVCYACRRGIGFLRAALRPLEVAFKSAFDGEVRAAFCSHRCKDDAIVNAAAVRRSFPGLLRRGRP